MNKKLRKKLEIFKHDTIRDMGGLPYLCFSMLLCSIFGAGVTYYYLFIDNSMIEYDKVIPVALFTSGIIALFSWLILIIFMLWFGRSMELQNEDSKKREGVKEA